MDKATPTPPPAYEAVTIQALDAAFAQEIRTVSSLEYNSNEMCRAFYANLRARLVEGCLAAQSAPLQQADCTCDARDMPFGRCCRAAAQVEPPSMPSSEWLAEAERLASVCRTHIATLEDHRELNAHLSKRVTAQVEPVRMLTEREIDDITEMYDTGRSQGAYDCAVAILHKFYDVNRGRVIPADGEVRS